MDILITEKARFTKDHLKHPKDPLVMTTVDEDAVNFESDLAPYLQERAEEGDIPEVRLADDERAEDAKVTLVWRSGAGIAMRATELHYKLSELDQDDVVEALKGVYGKLREPTED